MDRHCEAHLRRQQACSHGFLAAACRLVAVVRVLWTCSAWFLFLFIAQGLHEFGPTSSYGDAPKDSLLLHGAVPTQCVVLESHVATAGSIVAPTFGGYGHALTDALLQHAGLPLVYESHGHPSRTWSRSAFCGDHKVASGFPTAACQRAVAVRGLRVPREHRGAAGRHLWVVAARGAWPTGTLCATRPSTPVRSSSVTWTPRCSGLSPLGTLGHGVQG